MEDGCVVARTTLLNAEMHRLPDMIRPERQCAPHLREIFKPIVNAGDAGEGAGGVVENALDDVRRDVRIATRTLVRHPTFAITATLALALAIAVNTTMFSVLG